MELLERSFPENDDAIFSDGAHTTAFMFDVPDVYKFSAVKNLANCNFKNHFIRKLKAVHLTPNV